MPLRRQFGLLPLDGANVGVWDSTVVPRPYSREKPTTLSIKFKNMELKGQAILSKRVAIIKPRLSCLELIKVLELKAVRWYEYRLVWMIFHLKRLGHNTASLSDSTLFALRVSIPPSPLVDTLP